MILPSLRPYLLLILGAGFAQALMLSLTFPIGRLLTSEPLLTVDSAFHWYQMMAARAFAASGALVGYDPWFAAGHLGGVSYNASAKLPALAAVLAGREVPVAVVYKVYVFSVSVLAPGAVALTAWLLRLEVRIAAASTLLAWLAWWITSLHWYHTAGMVAFVLASYVALPYSAWVFQAARHSFSWGHAVGIGLIGAAGLFIHPLFPIPVFVLTGALLLFHRSEIRSSSVIGIALVAGVVAALPNLLWIMPSLRNAGWADNATTPYQKRVDLMLVVHELLGRVRDDARGARLNPILWLLTAVALHWTRVAALRRVALVFAVAALVLILYAALGAAIPAFATTTPNRMSAAAYLLLAVPGGIGLAALLDHWNETRPLLRRSARGALAVLALASLFLAYELWKEVGPGPGGRHGLAPPEVKGEGPVGQWALEALRRHTTADARILFETSGGRVHDGAHLAGYLALRSQREFIGGPYVFMHHAGYWDGHIFGRRIEAFDEGELRQRLTLYNVGWALVFTSESKRRLDRQPGVLRLESFRDFVLYAVDGPRRYALEAPVRVVERDFNSVSLSGLVGPSTTLLYHWTPGLRTQPARRIEAVSLLGDPQPFVRVFDPPTEIRLLWSPDRTGGGAR